MKWPWRKRATGEELDHTEAKEARERAQKDKEKVEEKWIDVHDTLRIIRPNGFGKDIRDRMADRRKKA